MENKKSKKTRLAIKQYHKKRFKGLNFIKHFESQSDEIFQDSPSTSLFIIHNSDAEHADYSILSTLLQSFGPINHLLMIGGIKYGFVTYTAIEPAIQAHTTMNQQDFIVQFPKKPHAIYLLYTPLSVRDLRLGGGSWCIEDAPIPGLSLRSEYLVPEQEEVLISELDQLEWEPLTNRRIMHFGYNFIYGANNVHSEQLGPEIPDWLVPVIEQLHIDFGVKFDQVTVNEYSPGNSIPPHTDSHSPFEELLVSISLLSGISMNFRSEHTEYNLYLPARSVLCFTGQARYTWKHSISQRKYDILEGNVKYRARRVSLTFRKIRHQPCQCEFPGHCDRGQPPTPQETGSICPTEVEKEYVYNTYNKIASHFSHTRYKPWPKVEEFLQRTEGFVLDIGCGNGKYLAGDPALRIGTDRSDKLLEICEERGFSVFTADCLNLPVQSSSFDGAICIAVIHHFSTVSLRLQAIREALRILKPSGEALFSVWAQEQTERSFPQQDNLVPWNLNTKYEGSDITGESVPEKNSVVYQRFYHVFTQNELEGLVSQVEYQGFHFEIVSRYYDKSNWCVVCKKY